VHQASEFDASIPGRMIVDSSPVAAMAGQSSAGTPQAPAGAEDPRVAHGVLLLKAAGVASAELVAHRDTWEWLTARAAHLTTP
jgi:hypothetical protein